MSIAGLSDAPLRKVIRHQEDSRNGLIFCAVE
jgi:hypothetical protein